MNNASNLSRTALRQKKERQEAAAIREAIISGYRDAIAGLLHTYNGDLHKLMKKVKP